VKRCDECVYFSHALDAMTDHVDYHSCELYEWKIKHMTVAEDCIGYKEKKR